jgi:ClpX C4-type zinc finger
MSWIDQDGRQSGEEEVRRHLRWMSCSGVLTLSVAVTAIATANARSFFYFIIPFVVCCFFTGRQWMEWIRAKRRLAAAPEDELESSREAAEEMAYRCSFCGKSQAEVTHLISSPQDTGVAPAHICDKCVEVCNSILADLSSGKAEI